MEQPFGIPRATVAEYETWPGDWELWHGVPVSMTPPPAVWHQRLASRVERAVADQLEVEGCRCEVLRESGWRIGDDTVLVPDLMVVCEPVDGRYVLSTPSVIVELLSKSTAGRDRLHKRDLYASAGVPHYVLMDPRPSASGPRLEALSLLDGGYAGLASDEPVTLELHPGCSIRLDPADFFDD